MHIPPSSVNTIDTQEYYYKEFALNSWLWNHFEMITLQKLQSWWKSATDLRKLSYNFKPIVLKIISKTTQLTAIVCLTDHTHTFIPMKLTDNSKSNQDSLINFYEQILLTRAAVKIFDFYLFPERACPILSTLSILFCSVCLAPTSSTDFSSCYSLHAHCGNLQYSCLGMASFCNSHYWCSSLVVAATRLLWQVILNCQTVATHKLNWQEVCFKNMYSNKTIHKDIIDIHRVSGTMNSFA